MAVAKYGEADGLVDGVLAEESAERGAGANFDIVDGENDVAFFESGLFGGGVFKNISDISAIG